MANITDQFVTSFSELYYSTTPIAAAADDGIPSEQEVVDWFSAGSLGKDVDILVEATVDNAGVTVFLAGTEFTVVNTAYSDCCRECYITHSSHQ